MTCRESRASFGRDLDGRIGAGERGALIAHLAGCAACREERLRFEAAARALRASGPTRVPAGLAARSYAAAMKSADAPLSLAAWFVDAARPAALAAAVAAVLVWVAAGLSPTATGSSSDAGAQDPMELAMHLWTGRPARMPPDTRRNRVVAWGLALLLLAIGAAGGMAVDRLLLGRGDRAPERGPPRPEEILERLRSDLELSDVQARAIGGILEERQRALSLLFSRVDPEAEGIRKEAAGRIRSLLDPAQQARFDERMRELERRRAELRRRFQASR